MWLIVFTALFILLVDCVFSLKLLVLMLCVLVSNNKGDFQRKFNWTNNGETKF